MSFISEVLISFTPQVFFGMIGGMFGGLFGIDKKEYGIKISTILLFNAAIAGSAVADMLHRKWGLDTVWFICFICTFAGLFAGFLMEAAKAASPPLAEKLVSKVGNNAIDRIP